MNTNLKSIFIIKIFFLNFSRPTFRQSTISVDSSVDSISRRPRVLLHQSMGSSHGFSMFGSVDSEQSVPRTAPLATPEQGEECYLLISRKKFFFRNMNVIFYFLDMSLMENFSFDNDPMNEVFQMDTVHESTNGHNDRIPTVQGKKQTNYGFDENVF